MAQDRGANAIIEIPHGNSGTRPTGIVYTRRLYFKREILSNEDRRKKGENNPGFPAEKPMEQEIADCRMPI